MISTKCDTCGKEFPMKENDAERSKHHFCSRICWGKWRSKEQTGEKNRYWQGGKIKVICEICKKEFELFPNYAKERKHLFCSQDCYKQWRKEQSEKNKMVISCGICGENIKIYKEGYDPNTIICCSKKCEGILKSQTRRGKNNPMFGRTHTERSRESISKKRSGKYTGKNASGWKGGVSFLPYCFLFNKRRRNAVRTFFANRCICCGKNVNENITNTGKQKELSVHHIDHDKEQGCNGRPFNLVPLCIKCHSKELYHEQEYKNYINKTLNNGFEWGVWSREQYEIEVMYPE